MTTHGEQPNRPYSIHDLAAFKARGERFAMLTAYDYPTAETLDDAGIPVLLVGDSLGMVVLGYDSTVPVTVDEMLHHTRAVARGASRSLVVADMPFMSYQASHVEGMHNAARFLKEGGADAVKVEGPAVGLITELTAAGVPVMGHVGLTPQRINQLGGFTVQGRGQAADEVVRQAADVAEAGACAVVVESVPVDVGRGVAEAVSVPAIGIGAGPHVDGQVLVVDDLVGMTTPPLPRFVKQYGDARGALADAAKAFQAEVASGDYPGPEHTY
jgi:3-methyl-2-oxobutanoate hydroxymethyltransferase